MKKRITSLLIACAILLGMLPVMGLTANATGTGVYVAGVEMAEGSYLANGAAETTATQPSGGYAYYTSGVLTLNNFQYEGVGVQCNDLNHAVIFSLGDLDVLLQGQNTLTQTQEMSMCIWTVGRLTVDAVDAGSATLSATAWGILSENNAAIDGGSVAISAGYVGVQTSGELTVNGGSLTTVAEEAGLEAYGVLTVNGGSVYAEAGRFSINAVNNMTVNGGTITVAGENMGINTNVQGVLVVNDGTITISGCTIALSGNMDMRFMGGTVKITDSLDGIHCSDGDVTVNGGTLEITAAYCAFNTNVDAGHKLIINGGTVDARSTDVELDEYIWAVQQELVVASSLTVKASTEPDGELVDYVSADHESYDRIFVTGEDFVCETHSYGQWYAVEIPTCQEYGKIGKTCKTCGYVTYADVEKIDHVYIPEVTPPTTTAQGYTTYTCYFCGDSYVDDYVPALEAEAQIDTVIYATVEEALVAAVPGDTVVLLKDVDASESVLLIPSGVTLDLLDYSLSAKSLIGLRGSCVTGTVVDKNGENGAKLVVSQNSIALSQNAPDGAAAGYKIIPVWNGDHYIFSQAVISNQSFTVGDGTANVKFLPNFSGYIKNNLFKPDGCEDNDVSIIISVSWMESGIRVTQEYFYTKSLVIDAMNNRTLFANMTGCDEKEALVFSISIVTDCGVEVVSQDYVYNNYK